MRLKRDPKDGLIDVIYNLQNPHDAAQYDEYKNYKQVRNEYFQGKITAQNALRYFEKLKYDYEYQMYSMIDIVNKDDVKQEDSFLMQRNESDAGYIGVMKENFPKYCVLETHRNRVNLFIQEIQEAESTVETQPGETPKKPHKHIAYEQSLEIDNEEQKLLDHLLSVEIRMIKSRGTGTPSGEPLYIINKPYKVPQVYRECEKAIKMKIVKMKPANIEQFMKKYMLASNNKKVNASLVSYLRKKQA